MDVSLIMLEWFKKADCISRAWFCGLEVSPAHLHVGCFFAERLSMIASKTYFLSLPSSYILLQLLFVMSQALLSGAYRAIISMHC